jgi:hypothetical protein
VSVCRHGSDTGIDKRHHAQPDVLSEGGLVPGDPLVVVLIVEGLLADELRQLRVEPEPTRLEATYPPPVRMNLKM